MGGVAVLGGAVGAMAYFGVGMGAAAGIASRYRVDDSSLLGENADGHPVIRVRLDGSE